MNCLSGFPHAAADSRTKHKKKQSAGERHEAGVRFAVKKELVKKLDSPPKG
jgi:hypothetical protein